MPVPPNLLGGGHQKPGGWKGEWRIGTGQTGCGSLSAMDLLGAKGGSEAVLQKGPESSSSALPREIVGDLSCP